MFSRQDSAHSALGGSDAGRPLAVEWAALGLVFLCAVALSLTRVSMTDTPWHLATARLAFASGRWPVTNTFSYTHPDYPLNQQYPVYQGLLYLVHSLAGWQGLSILHCLLWVSVFLLWMKWGGSFRDAARLSAVWVIALLGLQQRMILRPDILTMLFMALLLHAVDGYLKGRKWVVVLFVLIQFFMVNSHQLFPVGLAVQAALVAHLCSIRLWGGRLGISPRDKTIPVWPAALGFVGSLLVCFFTPLGLEIIHVTAHTMDSLRSHRGDVQEFARFWSWWYPAFLVALATALAALGFVRQRRSWQLLEVFLWLMGAALAYVAIRGVAYYVVISAAIFARGVKAARAERSAEAPATGANPLGGLLRPASLGVTVGLSFLILDARWVSPSRVLGGTQPGIGMALGVWPSPAIGFIKEHPPPGRMLNIDWYSGNPLIWELYPRYQVFSDPRFESYPRAFLKRAIAALEDQAVLEQFIVEYDPGWVVGWIGDADVRRRLAELLKGGQWSLVHADTVFAILVRNSPENAPYLAAHAMKPEDIDPPDFLNSEPDLLALQQIRMASLYEELGLREKSAEMIRRAEPAAGRYPAVRDALERFRLDYRTLPAE